MDALARVRGRRHLRLQPAAGRNATIVTAIGVLDYK
jgi:hypothetical protein